MGRGSFVIQSHHLCHTLSCHGDRVTSVERSLRPVGEGWCHSLKFNHEVWPCPSPLQQPCLFSQSSCQQGIKGFSSGGLWIGHPWGFRQASTPDTEAHHPRSLRGLVTMDTKKHRCPLRPTGGILGTSKRMREWGQVTWALVPLLAPTCRRAWRETFPESRGPTLKPQSRC